MICTHVFAIFAVEISKSGMKVFCGLVLMCLLMVSGLSHAQSVAQPFPFDPIFWAPTLKLSQEQQRRIQEINSEFYTQLKAITDRNLFPAYLQSRNTQIWDTFHTRQKRRWEKIMTRLQSIQNCYIGTSDLIYSHACACWNTD